MASEHFLLESFELENKMYWKNIGALTVRLVSHTEKVLNVIAL